jgi:hypothetical protein
MNTKRNTIAITTRKNNNPPIITTETTIGTFKQKSKGGKK